MSKLIKRTQLVRGGTGGLSLSMGRGRIMDLPAEGQMALAADLDEDGNPDLRERSLSAVSRAPYADAEVPAVKFGVKPYAAMDESPDQTDRIQAFLDELEEGQIGILPGYGWAKLGGHLLLPAGVDVKGAVRLFSKNTNATIPRLHMSLSPGHGGRNTRMERLRLYRVGLDLFDNIGQDDTATMCGDLDGHSIECTGYLPGYASATGADAIIIGNRAYNFHLSGASRVNQWAGNGIDIRANSERDGSGQARLGTGVNITIGSKVKFANIGGDTGDGYGGHGCAIRSIGGPKDRGSLHISTGALFDTCVSAIWADNENQETGEACAGGGMVITSGKIRIERCGKLITDLAPGVPTAQPAIFARRVVLDLEVVGLSFPTLPAGHRWADVRGCPGKIEGSVTGVPANCYIVHNDMSHSAFTPLKVDLVKSSGMINEGCVEPRYGRDGNTMEEATLVFTITKASGAAGAGSLSIALTNANGECMGAGALKSVAATGLAKSGSVNTGGTGKTDITYSLNGAGDALTITLGDRSVVKAFNAHMRRNSSGSSVLIDTGVGNGSFTVAFNLNTSGIFDLLSLDASGSAKQVEFCVSLASVVN